MIHMLSGAPFLSAFGPLDWESNEQVSNVELDRGGFRVGGGCGRVWNAGCAAAAFTEPAAAGDGLVCDSHRQSGFTFLDHA
jgi:hypothetical protein